MNSTYYNPVNELIKEIKELRAEVQQLKESK